MLINGFLFAHKINQIGTIQQEKTPIFLFFSHQPPWVQAVHKFTHQPPLNLPLKGRGWLRRFFLRKLP